MVANALGRGSSVATWIVVIPAVVAILGVEAFGLVGLYMGLQSLVAVLDYGVGTALVRELAGPSGPDGDGTEPRRTVRTLEVVYLTAGTIFAAGAALAAPWIATHWLRPETLAPEAVRDSIRWMGIALALQLPVALYTNGLIARGRHGVANTVAVGGSLTRAFGALALLAFVSPRVEVFFLAQVAAAGLHAAVVRILLHRALPAGPRGRFDRRVLARIGRFTAGATAVVVTGVLFAQADKVYLSRALPLESFGTYALAVTLGSGVYFLATPIFVATFPRSCRAWSHGEGLAFGHLFHQTSQLVSVVVLPIVFVIAFFPTEVLYVWTGNAAVAAEGAPYLRLVVVGFGILGWDGVHRNLQYAAGRTSLAFAQAISALVLYLPLLMLLTALYGALGAAAAWCLACLLSTSIGTYLTHTRVLRAEFASWLRSDLAAPAAAVAIMVGSASMFPSMPSSRIGMAVMLALVGLMAVAAAGLASPTIRQLAMKRTDGSPLDIQPR